MYELYPYFTNDGSVGLFSPIDDDIYHSTYGALSESWQKFILPSGLEKYLQSHESVKILDICYGIGYNTKTALNVFIKNFLSEKENSKNKKINFSHNFFKKLFSKISPKNCPHPTPNIAAIDTDNIAIEKAEDLHVKNSHENHHLLQISTAEIYADNMQEEQSWEKAEDNKNNENKNGHFTENQEICCKNILIDAVDLDKTLIYLSPFITDTSKLNSLFNLFFRLLRRLTSKIPRNDKKANNACHCEELAKQVTKQSKEINLPDECTNKNKYDQIKNINKNKKLIKKIFRLSKETSIILFEKMLEANPEFFNDENLQLILNNKKYAPFISRFMLHFAKFYQNQRSDYNKKMNKPTFLHNIYYRYISCSGKNAKKVLENCKIDLNIQKNDARDFILSSDTTYNFIFLDAFTPAKCPALWTVDFFIQLYSKLEYDGMILTYSNSAAVRNAFLQSGFFVGKIYDFELKKFIGTIATKNSSLIENKLDERDLDLINSKAGICFKDENLNLENNTILENRTMEVKESSLVSSSKILKGYKK